MSALLPVAAIAAIAAIGAAGTARGERHEVHARRAAGSLAKGAPPPLFHTTSYQAVEGIARQGLLPARGGSTFGAYAHHSRGRVFLAKDPDAAKDWFGKVGDMLEANASDDSELEEMVPVLLRISGRWRALSKVDPVGDQDVPGSVFVTERIPPEDISYWRPSKGWTSLAAWGTDPVEKGVLRWEEGDGARWPILRGTYDPGGFKPNSDAQFGRAWAKPKEPLRPSSLRVVWRGDAEATAREVLGALYPDRPGMVAALLPHAIGGDGLPDENLLNIKAQQLGYKGGVEIVGLTGLPPAERALLRGSRAKIKHHSAGAGGKDEALAALCAIVEKFSDIDLSDPSEEKELEHRLSKAGFPMIGSGGARLVFGLDRDRVAKVDMSPNGVANISEADFYRWNKDNTDLLNPVESYHLDGRIIVMPRASKTFEGGPPRGFKEKLNQAKEEIRSLPYACDRVDQDYDFNWGIVKGQLRLVDYNT